MFGKKLLIVVGTAYSAIAAIYETAADLPATQYDFVVVGGGTAGNVVANRLTENAGYTVLVIEAGVSNQDVLNSMVPFFCPRLSPNTPYDWNFTTTAQAGLNGRSIFYPRGHLLGGSSSINFMGYTRGSQDDWNRYARLTGDSGWTWNNVQPYFRKNEKFVRPADNHDTRGQFNPLVHSYTGINSVSLPGFPEPIDERVIKTTKELPDEFGLNEDYNSGKQYGISWVQSTIGGGQRSSSATSYLGPNFINRPNLHVLLHGQASRVLPTGSQQGKPVIRQVEFKDASGQLFNVTARKELILSSGSIGTPHILLNSGIGPADLLSSLGISTLVNNPSVGQNLSDHPLVGNTWPTNSTRTFEGFSRNATWQAEVLQEWQQNKTGLAVDSTFNHIGWGRVKDQSVFGGIADPSAGKNTAHFELVITNGLSRVPADIGNRSNVVVSSVVLSPTSRGSVTINSTDPFATPLINPNFLTSQPDIAIMREGIRSARRFMAATAWSDYITGPSPNNATTDNDLDTFIRGAAGSIFHPVGTSSMSPKGATWGVVDPDLKVKGVVGLRVVDASVLPVVPAGHTQAPTYVIAERASDLIKLSW